MSKSDIQLKQDIEEELRWDPKVNAAQIGVTVNHGAVSLLGTVDTYPQRWAAEDATRRVAGVRTVAHDLSVKVLGDHARTDADLADAVQNTFRWDVLVPGSVTAEVRHGVVTLKGQVNWDYQRRAAERAVRRLKGVVSTVNAVTLTTHSSPAQVREKIESALHRQAWADAKSIHVHTMGGTVTLTGHASSFQMVRDAREAAWATPGVTEVVDQVGIAATA